jgi:Ras-related GTP-binding protein C/D
VQTSTTCEPFCARAILTQISLIDAQDEPYDHVLQSFTTAVTRAVTVNPNIAVEVFINKVDGELFLSDESKYDCRRDVMTQVTDELTDAGVSPDVMQIRYHLTSIYDHSIYEALSRVVQRLIPQLPTLENLLNVLVSTCSMEKAYLFDVVSKLYISTDSGPVDMQSVELCSDMIDVVLDVSGIYGLGPSHEAVRAAAAAERSDGDVGSTGDALVSQAPADSLEEEMIDPDSAYDNDSASLIRLSNGMVREILKLTVQELCSLLS